MKKYVLAVTALSATAWLAYAASLEQPSQDPGSVTVASSAPATAPDNSAMFAGAPASTSASSIAGGASSPLQDPSTIIGLKLKHRPYKDVPPDQGEASQNNWRSAQFETGDLSYRQLCEALKAKGVTGLTLRIPNDLGEFANDANHTRPTYAQVYDEFAEFIRVAHDVGVPIYLWKRQWFARDDNPDFDDKSEDAIRDIKGIVSRTNQTSASNGQTSTKGISGFIFTEVNERNGAQIRKDALTFAKTLNQEPGMIGFLTRRTFVFPGGDLGAEFGSILDGLTTAAEYRDFYSKMDAETGYFAWSFKFFGKFEKDPVYEGLTTKEQILNYLRSPQHLGLDKLKTLTDWGKNNGYPDQSHVIFWGDNADTVSNMSDNERWAVKNALVTQNNWRGHFFNLAIANDGEERYDIFTKVNFFWPKNTVYNNPSQLVPNTRPDPRNRYPGDIYTFWKNWLN